MTEADMLTEVIVHESGHALLAIHHGAQLKEVSAIPNEQAQSAGNCRYCIGVGVSDDIHDEISAAGEVASKLWNARYRAGWYKEFIENGARSDRASVKGNLAAAQDRAKAVLEENWDELHSWVQKLHDQGRITEGIWELDEVTREEG